MRTQKQKHSNLWPTAKDHRRTHAILDSWCENVSLIDTLDPAEEIPQMLDTRRSVPLLKNLSHLERFYISE